MVRKRLLSLLLVIAMIMPLCCINVSASSLAFTSISDYNCYDADNLIVYWRGEDSAAYYTFKATDISTSYIPDVVVDIDASDKHTAWYYDLSGKLDYGAKIKVELAAYNSRNSKISNISVTFYTIPEINTLSATDVKIDSFTANGELLSDINFYTGFKMGTSKNNMTLWYDSNWITPYDEEFDKYYSCEPGTTYYYQAIAMDFQCKNVIASGDIKSITTPEIPDDISKPKVQTVSSSEITDSSVKLTGKITDTGGSADVEYGFYVGFANSNGTFAAAERVVVGDAKTAKTFSFTVDNDDYTILTSGETHDYCAYARNEAGESRGEIKQFTLDSSDEVDVEVDRFGLYITLASGDSMNSVTQNITLPTVGIYKGSTITWKSSNTSVISNTGIVTRPSEDSTDKTVTLTATIKKGTASTTQSFTLKVLKKEGIPVISNLTPSVNTVSTCTPVTFTVQTKYTKYVAFYSGEYLLGVASGSGTITYALSDGFNSAGTKTIVAYPSDASGKIVGDSSYSTTVVVTADKGKIPDFAITSPTSDKKAIANADLTATWNAPVSGTVYYNLYLYKANDLYTPIYQKLKLTDRNCTIPSSYLPVGDFVIGIRAFAKDYDVSNTIPVSFSTKDAADIPLINNAELKEDVINQFENLEFTVTTTANADDVAIIYDLDDESKVLYATDYLTSTPTISGNQKTWKFSIQIQTASPERVFKLYASLNKENGGNYKVVTATVLGDASIESVNYDISSPKVGDTIAFSVHANQYTDKVSLEVGGQEFVTATDYVEHSYTREFTLPFAFQSPGLKTVNFYAWRDGEKNTNTTKSRNVNITENNNKLESVTITAPYEGYSVVKGSNLALAWKSTSGVTPDSYNIYLNDNFIATTKETQYTLDASNYVNTGTYTLGINALKEGYTPSEAYVKFNVIEGSVTTTFNIESQTLAIGDTFSFSGKVTGKKMLEKVSAYLVDTADNSKTLIAEKTRVFSTTFDLSKFSSFVLGEEYITKSGSYLICISAKEANGTEIEIASKPITVTAGLASIKAEKQESETSNKMFKFTMTFPEVPQSAYLQFDSKSTNYDYLSDSACISNPAFKINVNDYSLKNGKYVYTKTLAINDAGNPNDNYNRKVRIIYKDNSGNTYYSSESKFIVNLAAKKLDKPIVLSPTYNQKFEVENDVNLVWDYSGDVEPDEYIVNIYRDSTSTIVYSKTVSDTELTIPDSKISDIGTYTAYIYAKKSNYENSDPASTVFIVKEKKVDCFISDVTPKEGKTNDTYTFSFTSSKKLSAAYILFDNPKESSTAWLTEANSNIPEFRFDITDYEINDDGDYVYTKEITIGQHGHIDNNYMRKFRVVYGYFNWLIPVVKKSEISEFTVTKNDAKGISDAVIEEVGATTVTVSAMPTCEYNSKLKGTFTVWIMKNGKSTAKHFAEGVWDGSKYVAKIDGLSPLSEYYIQAVLKERGTKNEYPQPSSSVYVKTTDYTPPIVEMKDISVRGTRVLLTAAVKDTSGSEMSYYGFALRWGEDGYEDLRASNYNKNTGEFSYDISVLKNGGGLGPNTEFTVIPYAKNRKATAQGEGAMQTFKTGSAGIHFVDANGYVINKRLYKNVGSKIYLKTNIYGSDYTSLKYVVYNKSYGLVVPEIPIQDFGNTTHILDTTNMPSQLLIIEAHLTLSDGSIAKTVQEIQLTIPVTGINIGATEVRALVGDRISITPEILPNNASNQKYTVIPEEGKNVIEVNGKDIIAKKEGVQYVAFTTVDGNYSKSIPVYVSNKMTGTPSINELFPNFSASMPGPNITTNNGSDSDSEKLFDLPIKCEIDMSLFKYCVEDDKALMFFTTFPISDDFFDADGFSMFSDYDAYKSAVKDKKIEEWMRKENNKNKEDPKSWNFRISGFIEFDYSKGYVGEVIGGGGNIEITTAFDKVIYLPISVPVYLTFGASGTGEGHIKAVYGVNGGTEYGCGLDVTIYGGLGAGAKGLLYAQGTINGNVNVNIQKNITGVGIMANGSVTGKVEAGVLLYNESVEFPVPGPELKWKYPESFQPMSLMSVDDENLSEIKVQISEKSRNYLSTPSSFNPGYTNQISLFGLNDEGTKIDQLVKNNLYPDNEVTSIELSDGRTLMVWVDDVGLERTSLNRTGLFYSICDNGVWSIPQRVDTNDYTADFSPELSNNNGEVYLSWQSADCIFEDGTELDEYYTHIGVSSMKFDGEKFVERQNFYSQDSKYRNMQKSISAGSKTATLWVTNSENDYTGLTGTNSIHYSECVDGVWSEEKIIVDNIPYLMEYSAAYNNGEIVVAYAADTDKNLASEEDINIYLCDESGDSSVVSSGTSYNPVISNNTLYWAKEDTVHSCDINNITAVNDVVVNNGKVYDFELFDNNSNKMIYWADGSKIYASMYTNGTWSTPSICTTVDGTINSISASGDDGTEFIASVKREDSDTVDLIVCNVVENIDLALSEYVSYKKTDVIPVGNLDVEISVENQGNTCVDKAEISFVDSQGNVLQTVEKDLNLNPYESKDLTVTYKLPSEITQQAITILVTPIGYEDSNDINNTASINIGNPELIIEKAETVYENGVPYIRVLVENSGYTAIENVPVNIKYNDETIITEIFNVDAKSSAEKLIVIDKTRFNDIDENVWLTAQIQADEWNLGYNDSETFLFINNKGENEFYIQSAELKNNILSLDINNKQSKEFTGTLNVVETYTDGTQNVEIFNIDLNAKSFEEVQVTLKPEKSLSSVEVSVYTGTSIRSNEVMYALSGYSIIDAKYNNGKVAVTVEKDSTNGYIIVALYNDKGAMISLSKQPLTSEDTYSFDIGNSAAAKARIFMWSDLSTLKPLCGAYELSLSNTIYDVSVSNVVTNTNAKTMSATVKNSGNENISDAVVYVTAYDNGKLLEAQQCDVTSLNAGTTQNITATFKTSDIDN